MLGPFNPGGSSGGRALNEKNIDYPAGDLITAPAGDLIAVDGDPGKVVIVIDAAVPPV